MMNLNTFFSDNSQVDKGEVCPAECVFKKLSSIPQVWIPPPQSPNNCIGMIISRDPTTAFIPYYSKARTLELPLWRQELFNSHAIPQWLCDRIAVFNQKYMQGQLSDDVLIRFRNSISENVYWTHLHKCCTDKRGEHSLKFKPENADICADRWLRYELQAAIPKGEIQQDLQFIVTLGKDVERWFLKEKNANLVDSGIRIYHLPHPSRANMASWYPKDEEVQKRLEGMILDLVELCQMQGNDSVPSI